jgi:hypothetical protein
MAKIVDALESALRHARGSPDEGTRVHEFDEGGQRTMTEIVADARRQREDAAARTVDLMLPWTRRDNAVYDRDGRLVFCVSIEGRRESLDDALSVARQVVEIVNLGLETYK